MSTVTKDLYDIGEAPPLGLVTPQMHAMTVRRDIERADELLWLDVD